MVTEIKGGYQGPLQTQQIRTDTARELVRVQKGLLFEKPGIRVKLDDLDAVVSTAQRYTDICQEQGLLPNFSGLAAMLGCSRRALYKVLEQKPDSPVGIFLEQARTSFTATRISAVDRGVTGEALSIFLLKNSYEYADRLELAPVEPSGPMSDLDPQAARERLLAAIPEEE